MAKKIRFKTQWNAHLFPKTREKNNGVSMTIPDQTLTVTQILQRHTRGIPFTAGKVPIYEGDEPTPDFKKMDISEIHDLVQSSKEFIDETKQKVNDKRSKKAEAEKKELEELRKLRDSQTNQQQPQTQIQNPPNGEQTATQKAGSGL